MGSHRFWRILCAGLFALVVAGCGGGGAESCFGGTDCDGEVPDDGTPTVSQLRVLRSSPQLSSNAVATGSGVLLTAIAQDANNNVVANAPVTFSTNDASALLIPASPTTAANGQVQANLTTGGDPANRTITVTVSSGSAQATTTVSVIGTTLTVDGPASAQFNTPTNFTAALVDSGGVGIPDQVVSVSTNPGNALSSGSLTTNASGIVTFTLTPTVASSFVTAGALGLSSTKNVTVSTDQFTFTAPAANALVPLNQSRVVSVRWLQSGAAVPDGTEVTFTATRGSLSASSATTVNGTASISITSTQAGESVITATSPELSMPTTSRTIQFVALVAGNIDVQADPAVIPTNGTSSIRAIVRDANNNVVANKPVEFNLSDTSGGIISSSTATTNSLGVAQITYTASASTTAQDGVRIDATARNADDSFVTDFATLTVGARAVRILLGSGNEIIEPNETVYDLPYSAIVTDAAGNPPTSASFNLSTYALRYFKGAYALPEGGGDPVPVYSVADGCPNEDVNRNGILDAGEDTNNNGRLDPGNPATVPSSPALGADGTVQFNVRYPQDRGNWIDLELRARVSASGTEATELVRFILPISEDDAENPPGFVSPYGTAASCSDPN